MSEGWGKYEPAPLEYFHSRLMKLFHQHRVAHSDNYEVKISGTTLNDFIAIAKIETYAKYPKQVSNKEIKKSEL